ncbi:hypothetical protein TrRE_jg5906, partial [Triparma retinervis]
MSEVVAATTQRVLEEVKLEIEDFEEEYEGKWRKVKEKVEMMRRTSEEEEKEYGNYYVVTTARVSLVISDRAVREIGEDAFGDCVNLWKIKAPFVEEVGWRAFGRCRNLVEVVFPNVNMVKVNAFFRCYGLRKVALPSARSIDEFAFEDCYDLRHITLHPDVEVDLCAFCLCLSLEVLAASTNFEVDTGDKDEDGYNDPTRGITRYLKWRNESDFARKEQVYTYMAMTKLCFFDEKDPNAPPARAKANDPISKFLVEKCMGDTGIGRHILSFFGERRGKGDLRGATKAELLAVG